MQLRSHTHGVFVYTIADGLTIVGGTGGTRNGEEDKEGEIDQVATEPESSRSTYHDRACYNTHPDMADETDDELENDLKYDLCY